MKNKDSTEINIKNLRDQSILMFKDIVGLLNKFEVNYWLDFGTLLGAVRDGEAMPWDGDFDLSTFDSHKIIGNTSFTKDLNAKGYKLDITDNNLKFTKIDWDFGYYVLDLHRLKKTKDGFANYSYGEVYSKSFYNRVNNLYNHVNSFLKIDNKNKRLFPSYDILCRALIQAGIDRTNIYNQTKLKVQLSSTRNSKSFFKISTNDFSFDNSLRTRVGADYKKGKLERFINLNNVPNFLILLLSSLLKTILKNADKKCQKEVFFPISFFNEFEKVELYGSFHNSPSPKEKYLENIYGNTWFKPIVTHNKSYLDNLKKE